VNFQSDIVRPTARPVGPGAGRPGTIEADYGRIESLTLLLVRRAHQSLPAGVSPSLVRQIEQLDEIRDQIRRSLGLASPPVVNAGRGGDQEAAGAGTRDVVSGAKTKGAPPGDPTARGKSRILQVPYKPGSPDPSLSPSLALAEQFIQRIDQARLSIPPQVASGPTGRRFAAELATLRAAAVNFQSDIMRPAARPVGRGVGHVGTIAADYRRIECLTLFLVQRAHQSLPAGVSQFVRQIEQLDEIRDQIRQDLGLASPKKDSDDTVTKKDSDDTVTKKDSDDTVTKKDSDTVTKKDSDNAAGAATRDVVIDAVEKLGGTVKVSVDLSGASVGDNVLQGLEGLDEMQSLNLYGTTVGDTGLAYLKSHTQLQVLNLYGTFVGDAGLVHLKNLVQLQSLDLANCRITDAGLIQLMALSQLQSLDLSGTRVSGTGLAHLKGLPQLATLDLSSTAVDDTGLMQLKGLLQLRTLVLSNTRVTDAGLPQLRGLTQLRSLSLDGCRVTDEAIAGLKQALPAVQITR
jgi:Leucine-rich repeat (LRR) protein